MYILSFFVLIIAFVLMLIYCPGGLAFANAYFDLPSIMILLIIIVPMLVASGMLKNFNNAFRIELNKNYKPKLVEIKLALEAVEFVMKELIYGGAMVSLFFMVVVIANLGEMNKIGPNLAVSILTILYALCINLILLPLKVRLRKKIIIYMEE